MWERWHGLCRANHLLRAEYVNSFGRDRLARDPVPQAHVRGHVGQFQIRMFVIVVEMVEEKMAFVVVENF